MADGDTTDDGSAAVANPSMYAAMLNPAMYGGGGGAPMGNWALAGMQPQLMFGQSLLRQAADVSPVRSPWQAAARAIGGMLGGYEVGQYGRQVGDLYRGWQNEANQLLGPTTQRPTAQGTPPAQQAPIQPAAAPANLDAAITAAAAKHGIPKQVLVGLLKHESNFDPSAVNDSSGATGLGQVLLSTAMNPGYGMSPLADNEAAAKQALLDPNTNIDFSAQYLAARGRGLFGQSWNPNDPQMMRAALNGYGDGTPGYADAVLAKGGATAPNVTVAANDATTDPQANLSAGVQAALELKQRIAIGLAHGNPVIQAMAPQLNQIAATMMQAGRYTAPVKDAQGQEWQTDLLTGQRKPSGAAMRPEAMFATQVQQAGAKILQGIPLTPTEQSQLDAAIPALYKPTVDAKTGVPRFETTPPAWVQQYWIQRTGGAAQAAPATGTATQSARTPALVEASIARANEDYKTDSDITDKFLTESMSADQTLGVTQQIRSLLASGKVTPGHFAQLQSAIGSIMAGAGYKPEEIAAKMSGWDQPTAELMTKFLTQLQMAKAREMGAREPGSVIQMFQNNYPNWQSRPETIEAFTRSLDMQTLYDKARAQAMVDWTQQNRGNVEGYQRIGSSDFKKFFQERADPRVYQAAALAASPSKLGTDAQGNRTWQPIPSTEWASGLNKTQKQAAATLAMQSFPGATVDWNGQKLVEAPQ